jgi:hypothetical protein
MQPSDDTTVLDDAGIDKEPDAGESGGGEGRIQCPVCAWQPDKDSRWMCSCQHMWNTFDTGGVCPACLLQWAYTACPSCGSWSRHSDWYRNSSNS